MMFGLIFWENNHIIQFSVNEKNQNLPNKEERKKSYHRKTNLWKPELAKSMVIFAFSEWQNCEFAKIEKIIRRQFAWNILVFMQNNCFKHLFTSPWHLTAKVRQCGDCSAIYLSFVLNCCSNIRLHARLYDDFDQLIDSTHNVPVHVFDPYAKGISAKVTFYSSNQITYNFAIQSHY